MSDLPSRGLTAENAEDAEFMEVVYDLCGLYARGGEFIG
jgi:hypothetical protein